MKRFLAAMTLGMTLVMGAVSVQAADLSVMVNGAAITFDAQPFIEQGVTLVPMRAIMDSLGATVQWNAQTKTVTATKDDKTVVLTIDSKVAMVNGQAVELEAAAKIVGNRTFVPVKFIGEQFGLNVEWNEEKSVVSLIQITAQPAPTPEDTTKDDEIKTDDTAKDDEAKTDDTAKDDETKTDDTVKDDEIKTDDTVKDDETKTDEAVKDDETKTDDTTKDDETKTDDTAKDDEIKTDDTAKDDETKTDDTAKDDETKTDDTAKDDETKTDDTAKDDTIKAE